MGHRSYGLLVARTHGSGKDINEHAARKMTIRRMKSRRSPSSVAAAASSDAVIVTSRASADRKRASNHTWYIRDGEANVYYRPFGYRVCPVPVPLPDDKHRSAV